MYENAVLQMFLAVPAAARPAAVFVRCRQAVENPIAFVDAAVRTDDVVCSPFQPSDRLSQALREFSVNSLEDEGHFVFARLESPSVQLFVSACYHVRPEKGVSVSIVEQTISERFSDCIQLVRKRMRRHLMSSTLTFHIEHRT